MIDRLSDLVAKQYEQQDEIVGRVRDWDAAAKLPIVYDLTRGLAREIDGYLTASGANTILPRRDQWRASRAKRTEEVVDILKFALSLAHLDGITPDELYNEFLGKTDIVRRRNARMIEHESIIGFDLDGVICDFVGGGFPRDASEDDKRKFFDDGLHLDCEPMYGAAGFVREVASAGWGIVIVTARKTYRHATIERDTYRWLDLNGIPFDRVIFAYDKATAILDARLPLRCFVEDSPKHALDIAEAGIPVIQVNGGFDALPKYNEKIAYVRDMADARILWGDAFLSTDGRGGREDIVQWASKG